MNKTYLQTGKVTSTEQKLAGWFVLGVLSVCFCFCFCFLVFETQSCYIVQAGLNLLCGPSWPQTHNPAASAF